jgi:alcohol dehydrogenase class IV
MKPMSEFENNRLFAGFRAPREIIFGAGQRHSLPKIVGSLGSRVFFCVDPSMVTHPEVNTLMNSVAGNGTEVEVFSDVSPELPMENIAAAVSAAKRHSTDAVVAIGGGSSIDLAKLVSCMLTHPGEVNQYFGEFVVPGPILPIVAIPTTAGTGSEVTPVAVMTDTDHGMKAGVSSPYLIPTVALCDPELTLTCPPSVTAASGADALTHCIESYTAIRRDGDPDLLASRVAIGQSRLTSSMALEGIQSISDGLLHAYREPSSLHARAQVMYGALLGGLAFGTAGNAAAHALQYPVGAATRTPHGVGTGLLMPYVMEYNLQARTPEYAEIARIIGRSVIADDTLSARVSEADHALVLAAGSGTSADVDQEEQLATSAARLLQLYLSGVEIPSALSQIGFDPAMIGSAAEKGLSSKRLCDNNPIPLDTSGAESILQAAMSGRLSLR